MFGLPTLTQEYVETFSFVLLRIVGLFIASSVLSRKNIPFMVRAALILTTTFVLMNVVPPVGNLKSDNLLTFFLSCTMEMLLGMVLGYINTLIVSIASSAGMIADLQIGFGLSGFFDELSMGQYAISGSFFSVLFLLCFFCVDGHLMLIRILAESFNYVAPGAVSFSQDLAMAILTYFIGSIILTLKAAMPVVAVILVIEVSLGIIVKTMPQMNVFIVGIPLKILVGLVMLFIFLPALIMLFNGAIDYMYTWQRTIFRGMI